MLQVQKPQLQKGHMKNSLAKPRIWNSQQVVSKSLHQKAVRNNLCTTILYLAIFHIDGYIEPGGGPIAGETSTTQEQAGGHGSESTQPTDKPSTTGERFQFSYYILYTKVPPNILQ